MREVVLGGHGDRFRAVVGLIVGATGHALPPRWGGLWLVSVAGVILSAAVLLLPLAVRPEASRCIAAAVVHWRSVILFAAALMLFAVWLAACIRIATAVVDWRSSILRVADY